MQHVNVPKGDAGLEDLKFALQQITTEPLTGKRGGDQQHKFDLNETIILPLCR
jgi:hypothetical protein